MRHTHMAILALATLVLAGCNSESMTAGSVSETGQAGSMARFAMRGDYLYALSGADLVSYHVAETALPTRTSRISINWDVETLFTYGTSLFIGSETGVHIYSLEDPGQPRRVSTFGHVRSCDPVVVQDSIAYLTLNGNAGCWGASNELQILDVRDMAAPRLMATLPMTDPHGLAIREDKLFICDGLAGLKVYQVGGTETSRPDVSLLHHVSMADAYDIILLEDRAIVIAADGLYQFALDNGFSLLSRIPILEGRPMKG